MSIISIGEALAFLDIGTGYFEITAENDVLSMTSDQGGPVDIDIPDLTYEGDDLATALQIAMNANDTLTGTGTITFAVSYASSTYLFTINSGSGHTITIDVSASDAALEFGFTEDPTAVQSIVSDQVATEDPTAPVQVILDGVDSFVKGYCDREFEAPSSNYKEYHNGNNRQNLFLKQYPIISISRLSIGRNDGIKVNNTGTATYATVSVTSTGVVLNKDGTTTTLLFADTGQTTIAGIVTAIGNETGWQAEVITSSYSSFDSTELIEVMGLQCLDATWAYLEIPDEPESDFDVYAEEGYLFKGGGFARGHRNIRVDYTAGYATLPSQLKMACLILVKFIYQKREEEVFGRKQYGAGNIRATLEAEMPGEVRLILDKFARKDV